MLHNFAFLVTLFFSTSLFSSSLDITILTSKSEDRQSAGKSFAGITVKPHRPVLRAVELAVLESSTFFEMIGIQAEIQQLELRTEIDYQQQLKSISPGSLVIMDLPLNIMEQVARVADQMKLVAFNVRHSDSRLSESLCLPHVFHTIPSDSMYFDALGQFLVHRGWRKVLLVKGPSQQDTASQVDLYKGTRGSIRRWNHQLRQPILLAAPEAVIAVAPMPKFLHPKHCVDTLAVDEPESKCQLQ